MTWLHTSARRLARRLPTAAERAIVGVLTLVLPACAPNDDPGHARDDTVVELASVGPVRLSTQPTPGYGLGLGLTFTRIEPGTFRMGSTDGQADERPTHTVTLSEAFELGTHEVTQAQWFAVMETTPADQLDLMRAAVGNPEAQGLRGVGDDVPMYLISWTESQRFVDRLSRLDADYDYRLPTEAEWEYAARAGTDTAYSFGDDPGALDDYAWFYENANLSAHPVGSKRPNPWGLYDMHGNVWEWVSDHNARYSRRPTVDPVGPSSGDGRSMRGGGWSNPATSQRSAHQTGNEEASRSSGGIGLRLVRMRP